MSGWIKLEKDLLTDPRFVAAAMELEARFELISANEAGDETLFTDRNVTPLPAVTLLIGGLARLWMIADTHIGQDDVLALNAHQVDKLVGIDGFCEILPDDWLEILDGDRVKLPNYHRHNGTTAKERSSNAERQARFRASHRDSNNKHSNAVTLPDQDLDKTKTESKSKTRVSRLRTDSTEFPEGFSLDEPLRQQALSRAADCDVEQAFEQFKAHHVTRGSRFKNWRSAWVTWIGNFEQFGYPKRKNGAVPPKGMENVKW